MAQKTLRGYLARKQHQPRYKGIVKINAIRRNMKQMEEIANQLKGQRDVMLKNMKDIEVQIDAAIKKIKVRKKKFPCGTESHRENLFYRPIPRLKQTRLTFCTTRLSPK